MPDRHWEGWLALTLLVQVTSHWYPNKYTTYPERPVAGFSLLTSVPCGVVPMLPFHATSKADLLVVKNYLAGAILLDEAQRAVWRTWFDDVMPISGDVNDYFTAGNQSVTIATTAYTTAVSNQA